ncbi:membrane protein [Microbacterium phage Huwbert]|nr:membrane protein [Microbacterium phage Huwbert]
MIYDLGMINQIDPLTQLALGFLVVALVGSLLSLIGWGMTRSAERKEAGASLNELEVARAERIH